MATLNIEEIDLASVLAALRGAFATPPTGAVVGRTQLRDVVVRHLSCSQLEAELLVDTLVARELVRLVRSEDGREVWVLSAIP